LTSPRSTPSETPAIPASSRIVACSPSSAPIAASRCGVMRSGMPPVSRYSVIVAGPLSAPPDASAIRATLASEAT
jgi:hypothetical protein